MNGKPVKLAIIGGGAAGMFAAAVAAERKLSALLIERKARLGSKVLMTANGRCNFTKDIAPEQFLRDLDCFSGGQFSNTRQECRVPFGNGERVFLTRQECRVSFVEEAIRECPPRKIISGFKSLNVPLRRMTDGRMFPADGKAATIVHAFGDLLRDEEFPILTNCAVRGVERFEGFGGAKPKGDATFLSREKNAPTASLPRFIIHTQNFDLLAENVLLATGGVSYPKTGSVGDGQNFARSLGHSLVPYRPGLIGLETADPRVTKLAGCRFEDDGRVKVLAPDGRTLFDYRGEVDCERFGLSGAAVYNAQRFLEHYRAAQDRTVAALGDRRSNRSVPSHSDLTLEVWFGHNRLQFANLKPRPVKEAIVTIGGIATDEIDPHTMESNICPGLYFAGEVMDIDGPTGGYNLTLAFATARKAVTSIR